jgi:hypothetical protein
VLADEAKVPVEVLTIVITPGIPQVWLFVIVKLGVTLVQAWENTNIPKRSSVSK